MALAEVSIVENEIVIEVQGAALLVPLVTAAAASKTDAETAAALAEGFKAAAEAAAATAATDAQTLVTAEGTTQIALVDAAGAAQITAIASTLGSQVYASTADALSKGVWSVTITAGGTGGTDGTYAWTTTGGTGTGATGWLTIAGGAVTAVGVTNRGKGYTAGATLAITGTPGGSGRTLTLVVAQNETAGKRFVVAVAAGEYSLYVVDSGGTTATLIRNLSSELTAALQMLNVPSIATPMPTGAISDVAPIDSVLLGGRRIPSRGGATASKNLFFWSSGDIRAEAVTGSIVTNRYANGPTGTLTATRLLFTTTSHIWRLFNSAFPAGDYKIRLKIKSTAGAGNQNIKTGVFNTLLTTHAITEGSWTTVDYSFTSNGTTPANFSIYTDTGGSYPVDVLVDEIQVYEASDTIPAWASEPTGIGGLVKPALSLPGSIPMSNWVQASAVNGAIRLNRDFTVKAFTSGTAFALIKEEGASSTFASVLLAPTADGTTYYRFGIGTESGWLSLRGPNGATAGNPPADEAKIKIQGEGWQIVGVRWNATQTDRYFHDILRTTITAANSGLNARYLIAGGAGNSGSGTFNGKIGGTVVYDRCLSNVEVQQVVDSLRDRLGLFGEGRPGFRNFYIIEGDSISAVATPRTYGWQQRDKFTPTLKLMNFAFSGSTMTSLETRLASVLTTIGQAKKDNRTVIVSVLIGRNDLTLLTAANRAAYMVRLLAYCDTLRETGAKVILCTILPSTATPGYDADRTAVNVLIRAATANYDGLCDFAANATMGPDGAASNLTYYSDGTHPTQAGQDILAGLMQTAITPLLGV